MYRLLRHTALDILFERDDLAASLEEMAPEEFRARATLAFRMETKKNSPRSFALFSYKDPLVRALVTHIKYKGNNSLIRIAGSLLFEEMRSIIESLQAFEDFTDPILISVPLFPKRQEERGFNQSEKIAREMKRLDTQNTFTLDSALLIKILHTESQAKLTRKERLANLKGAFHIADKAKIKGRNIIILDDVITTGATTSEIYRTFKKAGARKIIAVALAH